eukprot:RCo002605
MSRKVSKIQEFMSNQGSVNCAKWGKKAGQLIATGGQDRKVNVWKLGCPNIVSQLHGHTSIIESVTFDSEEELVVSGSAGGTIKVWDLNSERMQKSYNYGHKTNVTCLDYHPFGNFFCSGSADTQVKVWDLRKKSYLQTYKGHSKPVNTLKFSPDGRWVVSGGGDGVAKLWDLTAGKQMEDFTRHSAEITSLDFHPTEFLLAVGSADRTITFWDLDKFKLISQSQLDARGIRCIRFTPDGSALCGATSDSMKVYGWEPSVCHDAVDVHWQNISDIHINERTGDLYGLSFVESFVSVWMVRLQKMRPFSRGALSSSAEGMEGELTTPTSAPVRLPSAAPSPLSMPTEARPTVISPQTRAQRLTEVSQQQEEIQKRFGLTEAHRVILEQQRLLQEQKLQFQKELERQRADIPEKLPPDPPRVAKPAQPPTPNLLNTRVVPAPKDQPLGLEVDKFVPKAPDDSKLIEEVLADHDGMCQMLSQRVTNLKVVKSLWQNDRRGAIAHVQNLRDTAVSVDFLKQVVKTRERELTIDLCVGLLPTVEHVLHSTFESHLVVALEAVSALWHAFGDFIGKTLAARTHVVDVVLEERKDKCRIAKNLFGEIRHVLETLKERKDDVGYRSRILWKELPFDTFD